MLLGRESSTSHNTRLSLLGEYPESIVIDGCREMDRVEEAAQ
jgi:hypothetical protein